MLKFVINVFVLLIFSFNGYSQTAESSSIDLKQDITKSLLINGQSLLYNGFNFYDYAPNYFENGFPFFLEDGWINGNVNYEGTIYYQIPLKYDLIKDELIVQHFNKLSSITLLKDRVNDFSIDNHKFINLKETDTTNTIPAGFYEELYHQNLVLLAKRKKDITEKVQQSGVKRNIEILNKYYVCKQGKFYQYKSPSSLVKILKDNNKELSSYLKSNKKQFKESPEKAMVAIANYYDKIQK